MSSKPVLKAEPWLCAECFYNEVVLKTLPLLKLGLKNEIKYKHRKTILVTLMSDNLSFEDIQKNKQYLNTLDINDFYYSFHKILFKAIVELDATNMPLDETFIIKK